MSFGDDPFGGAPFGGDLEMDEGGLPTPAAGGSMLLLGVTTSFLLALLITFS